MLIKEQIHYIYSTSLLTKKKQREQSRGDLTFKSTKRKSYLAMARRLNNFFLVAVAVAALLQGSTAQTTHVVGNALGWIVPSTPNVYSTWAANQTFKVGDFLVFNFVTGNHDVAQVTKTAYDACNTSSPINRVTNSPANITLSAGEHFYICTFPGHCNGGQKLAINVSAASAPTPQPSSSPSPSPVPAPTPTPTVSPPTAAPTPTPTVSPPTAAPTPASPTAPSTTPTTPSPTATPPTTTPTAQSPGSGSGSGSASPPAPGNSAKSLHTAGLSATILAIVVGLLY